MNMQMPQSEVGACGSNVQTLNTDLHRHALSSRDLCAEFLT